MLEGKLADIYRSLWIDVDPTEPPTLSTYVTPAFFRDDAEGSAGLFATHEDGELCPRIYIPRDRVPGDGFEPDVDGADLGELIALAHERGHQRSYARGTYEERCMSEEHRAWFHAREILTVLGFMDWDAFEAAKEVSLRIHTERGTPNR